MAKPSSTPPQHGREAVVAALVEAATRLFAAHGPDGVSLRAIATEADVNYGLIHQYVGTKDDLLRLVFRAVSEEAARDFTDAPDLAATVDRMLGAGRSPYVAMLAWALLQGRDATELLGRSPALGSLAERLEGDHEAARVAALAAMALGWQLFGPFIAAGIGHAAPDDERLVAELHQLARHVLQAPVAWSPD